MMYQMMVFKRSNVILDTPVFSEREFFKNIFYLQSTFSGTARAFLYLNDRIVHSYSLGVKPCRIFNSVVNEWKSFEEFVKNPLSFSVMDRYKYAFWIKDKIILTTLFE